MCSARTAERRGKPATGVSAAQQRLTVDTKCADSKQSDKMTAPIFGSVNFQMVQHFTSPSGNWQGLALRAVPLTPLGLCGHTTSTQQTARTANQCGSRPKRLAVRLHDGAFVAHCGHGFKRHPTCLCCGKRCPRRRHHTQHVHEHGIRGNACHHQRHPEHVVSDSLWGCPWQRRARWHHRIPTRGRCVSL